MPALRGFQGNAPSAQRGRTLSSRTTNEVIPCSAKFADLIDALATRTGSDNRQPDEFTAAEYQADAGVNNNEIARRQLRQLVDLGKVEVRRGVVNGRAMNLYRRKQ
jgi:hypothetical protein